MKRTPKIGAYVLETLTTGMYHNPLDTVRELVQNAADAVRKAEETDILKKNAGRVEITLGHNNRSLVVLDNGTGLPSAEAPERLMDVGMSDKEIERDAGFRGIGRLAGIAFCDELKFRTSAKGENQATVIKLDCVGIRKAISPDNRRRLEMAEVLAKYATVSTEQAKGVDHFFEVTMAGIGDAGAQFLDVVALEKYLSQVAPVDFDPQDFLFAPKIQKWLKENDLRLPTIALAIATPDLRRQVFKPYRNRHTTSYQREGQYDVEIKDVLCLLDDRRAGPQFWIWRGVSDLAGTFGEDSVAGFRLRKNNIALGGPERVAELFAEKAASYYRLNAWFVGEIHVLCPNAIPNGRRDGFENTGSWPAIRQRLLPFVAERASEAHGASGARNAPIVKLVRRAERVIQAVETATSHGLASAEERDKRLEEVRQAREKIETRLQSRSQVSDGQVLKPLVRQLDHAEARLQDNKHFLAKKVRPSLDRKQRKLLQELVGIVHSVLDQQSCKKARDCGAAIRAAVFEKYGVGEA
jgi:molecular chaperone HtpG